jgi:zinc/manganese transport system substrate-binding protein
MWQRIGRVLLVLGALAVAPLPAAAQPRLKVVATFSILADMVANVGGDRVEMSVLVGPDADAHTYQPTPAEARVLAASQVLVLNGLGFEGWIDRLAAAAPFRGRRIVASEGVTPLTAKAGGHHHGHSHAAKPVQDPHCWQDLACGQRYVANIGAGLAAADPSNAVAYRERAEAYARKLAELDAWVRAQIATVPVAKRRAITGHDSFGYFARAYGVEFRAPAGINTQSEPSAREVANLIAQIRREGIRAVFMENMTNPVMIQQVARDAGAVVGPTLYVDALSKVGGPADSYEKMFRHNVLALVTAMAAN